MTKKTAFMFVSEKTEEDKDLKFAFAIKYSVSSVLSPSPGILQAKIVRMF